MHFKVKWALENGFNKKYCTYRNCTVYEYKGYEWTLEEMRQVPFGTLMRYKRFYDGEISEEEIDR